MVLVSLSCVGCKTRHRGESDGLDLGAGYTIIDLGIGALKNDFFASGINLVLHITRRD